MQASVSANLLQYDLFNKLIYTCKPNSVTFNNFLKLLISERSKFLYNFISNKETFSFNQTIKQVVENLLLSKRGSLVCLDQQKVITIVQTLDLFRIFLSSDEN